MVSRILRNFTRSGAEPYRLRKLIDSRTLEEVAARHHVVCDIDKTYLETEFESLVRMARIAFESASDKVTVAGASEVLRLVRWGDDDGFAEGSAPGAWPRPLHFVSSSPPQLRAVLEEKLMMDDLDWTSDTFKDQAYNLVMGRMDLLRHHVAYKSMAILSIVAQAGLDARFSMIGDNAESDAYIYLGVKLASERLLSPKGYAQYLEIAGVEKNLSAEVVTTVKNLPKALIKSILIRNVPGYSLVRESPLTDVVRSFDNFFQAALFFVADGLIAPSRLWNLVRSFHNHYGFTLAQLSGMLLGLAESPSVPLEVSFPAREAFTKINTMPDGDSRKVVEAGLAPPRDDLTLLPENEILKCAEAWMKKIRSERERERSKV